MPKSSIASWTPISLEAAQDRAGAHRVGEDHALGDLQLEPVGGNSVLGERGTGRSFAGARDQAGRARRG